MGIDIKAAQFLRYETRKNLSLGHLLTLGHQSIYIEKNKYRAFMESIQGPADDQFYADKLLRSLGATSIDVMDISAYEGANVIHDLNQPIGPEFRNRYDSVFDGGALEHVFNFPTALKNCLEMVKVGGHFLAATPSNNYCGHGFYQFSPELYYNVLSAINGFSIEKILFFYQNKWYTVVKPIEAKTRIELLTYEPTLIFIAAKKIEQKEIFKEWPQQSDYVEEWNIKQSAGITGQSSIKENFISLVPFLKLAQARWRQFKVRQQHSPKNRSWFTEIDIGSL